MTDRSRSRSKVGVASRGLDCPWDTIRMVPTESMAGHKTSLDSQFNHDHAIFTNPEVVEPELRTFEGKPPFNDEKAKELFQKQNPSLPVQ